MIRSILNRILHKLAFVVPGGYSLRPYLHKLRGVALGEKVWISQMVYIDELHPEAVTIGDNSSLGIRSSVITHFYWGPKKAADAAGEVRIGRDVFVGPHCVVLPNVTIGDGAVIVAGTVVSRNVPAGAVWGYENAAPVARASVPLTHETSYAKFTQGLRPFR
jgi:acetyltransferase-like isoleucine patch superfamily enzyme